MQGVLVTSEVLLIGKGLYVSLGLEDEKEGRTTATKGILVEITEKNIITVGTI